MNFCFIRYCQESAQGSEDLDQIDTTEFKSFLDSPEVPSSDESQVDLAGDDIKSKMLDILLDKDIQSSKENTVTIEGRNIFQYQILPCLSGHVLNHLYHSNSFCSNSKHSLLTWAPKF